MKSNRSAGHKPVSVHQSLTQRKYFWGVGGLIILADFAAAWLLFVVFRLSPAFWGGLLFLVALSYAVRVAREKDQFAIEIAMREMLTEKEMPAQPQVCEKPHEYRSSISSKT